MRIIQGKYKGRLLEGFHLEGTRPTMDRVKESVFAMLQPFLENSSCLDLFAGSGNLGIEALSMGARKVIFVDSNKKAFSTIVKNLEEIGEEQPVICMDFQQALEKFQEKEFDIIFLDPPYDTSYIQKALKCIQDFSLLKESGMVVCESDSLLKIAFDLDYYIIWKEKKYGDKYIRILKKRGKNE